MNESTLKFISATIFAAISLGVIWGTLLKINDHLAQIAKAAENPTLNVTSHVTIPDYTLVAVTKTNYVTVTNQTCEIVLRLTNDVPIVQNTASIYWKMLWDASNAPVLPTNFWVIHSPPSLPFTATNRLGASSGGPDDLGITNMRTATADRSDPSDPSDKK